MVGMDDMRMRWKPQIAVAYGSVCSATGEYVTVPVPIQRPDSLLIVICFTAAASASPQCPQLTVADDVPELDVRIAEPKGNVGSIVGGPPDARDSFVGDNLTGNRGRGVPEADGVPQGDGDEILRAPVEEVQMRIVEKTRSIENPIGSPLTLVLQLRRNWNWNLNLI